MVRKSSIRIFSILMTAALLSWPASVLSADSTGIKPADRTTREATQTDTVKPAKQTSPARGTEKKKGVNIFKKLKLFKKRKKPKIQGPKPVIKTPPEKNLSRDKTSPEAVGEFRALSIATPALKMTGRRFEPVTVTTGKLQMTGRIFEPVKITTGKLQMTGRIFEPVAINTGALVMTGKQFTPISVVTASLQMTGRNFAHVSIQTPPLNMTGNGPAGGRVRDASPSRVKPHSSATRDVMDTEWKQKNPADQQPEESRGH